MADFEGFADFSQLNQPAAHPFTSSNVGDPRGQPERARHARYAATPLTPGDEEAAMIEVHDMGDDKRANGDWVTSSSKVRITFWELSLWDLDSGDPDGADYSLSSQTSVAASPPLQGASRIKRLLISSGLVTPAVERKFISDACGSIEAGKLTCVAVPYRPIAKGFINLLAGTKTHGEIEGQLLVQYRGAPREEAEPGSVAFLDSSNDLLLRNLTVRHYLYLAAWIRSAPSVSRNTVMEKVTKLLHDFRLERFANVKMAGGIGPSTLGRLNESLVVLIAELLGDPLVLYGIDPLDGLTADEASQYVQLLKQHMKETGLTVVFYLNRPGSDVFHQLDSLVLLASTGELAYCGPAKQAEAHFSMLGYPCPEGESPGRHLVSLFDDGYQVMIGKEPVNASYFAEKYRETLTETVQPFATSSRRNVERVSTKGKSSWWTQLQVSMTRAFTSRFERAHILAGLVKFLLFTILFATVSVTLPVNTKNGQEDRMSLLFISVLLFHLMPAYSYRIVSQERSLFVKERRFGHAGFITPLFSTHFADTILNVIPASLWMLMIYFMVPFLYEGEDGPKACIIFFITLFLSADMGMSFLLLVVDQVCVPSQALSTFFYVVGFLNSSLAGFFVHPYNISTFWKPFLWISPVHLGWSTLILTEFSLNYKYSTAQTTSIESVGLWLDGSNGTNPGLLMQPEEILLVLVASCIVLRLLSALIFSFRKLN